MERRDYILREIEKIGQLLSMIFDRISGKHENYSIKLENQFEEEKELLREEMGFDLDAFLSLEKAEAPNYLSGFKGLNGGNIELLADILFEMGTSFETSRTIEYLDKSLILYELCNSLDKTYSMERESKINDVKNALNQRLT